MGYYDNYLEHHGILGQKWGVRRFQDKSGRLTAEGKTRRQEYEEAKNKADKAKSDYNNAKSKYRESHDSSDKDMMKKASGLYDLRKKQVSDAKARIKMEGRSRISKREQQLIEKYKSKGMNDDEAQVAAYKRAKLEKTLIAAGAVTLTTAAAYGAKKYHDYVTDELLEVGKVQFKRVTSDNSNDLHDVFYVSFGKKDPDKYVGILSKQLKEAGYGDNYYQKTIDLKENLKIASDKKAKTTMAKILRDSSQDDRSEILGNLVNTKSEIRNPKQIKVLEKGIWDIRRGNYNTKAVFDSINIVMPNNNSNIVKTFQSTLKNEGYSGIKDRDDILYSGFNAKTARIMFDNSKVKVSDVRKLSDSEIDEKYLTEYGKIYYSQLGKRRAVQGLAIAGIVGGVKATQQIKRTVENNKIISNYKKEHPNSTLSNDEILENYYGGDQK